MGDVPIFVYCSCLAVRGRLDAHTLFFQTESLVVQKQSVKPLAPVICNEACERASMKSVKVVQAFSVLSSCLGAEPAARDPCYLVRAGGLSGEVYS